MKFSKYYSAVILSIIAFSAFKMSLLIFTPKLIVECTINIIITSIYHYITLHCIALHCIALHCISLHCIAFHCITLHYITLKFQPLSMRSDCVFSHARSVKMAVADEKRFQFFLKLAI